MSTLLQARQMMQAGNFQGAREIIYAVIRTDPNNIEAWQLAMDAAPHDQARLEAHAGLQRALANTAPMRPTPPPIAGTVIEQPLRQQPPPSPPQSPYVQPYSQPQQYQQQPYQQQPYIQQPIVINAGVPAGGINAMQFRPTKDYLPEALLTLALYVFGVGVFGVIANVVFLMNARRDRDNGIETYSVGCLNAMLILNVIIILLGCVVGALIAAAPLIFATG